MIGLECESGNIVDCDLSMTMEVLPYSCKGTLMFSSESEKDCGTKCNKSNSRNAKNQEDDGQTRRGWTKYMRYESYPMIIMIALA